MTTNASRLRRLRLALRRRRHAPGAPMTMVEHLGELRSRIIICAVAFVVASAVAFGFYEPILHFFRRPLCDAYRECELNVFRITGFFMFRLKLTALVGLALASPVWLYQIYAFVLPALTPKEKRYTWPFIVSSVVLFALGAAFGYLALPTGLDFLLSIGGEELRPVLGAEEYLNFVGFMLLGFGLTFELPLVLVFLGLAEFVTVDQLRRARRGAVVGIVTLAAVVTPSQDPYTLLLMSVPLYLLYEATIVVLSLLLRNRPGTTA